MNFFYLFPGQGSQKPGMAADFYENSPAAKDILDRAQAVIGDGFLDTVFNGSPEQVTDTNIAQTALLAHGAAITAHLEGNGITPSGAAGHSLGEISALFATGALEFEDAMRIVKERARLMSEDIAPGTMAAVIGFDPEKITPLLPEGTQVANFNGPGQTIISGEVDAVQAASAALKEAGAKRVLPLKVSGAFHSFLMQPAADGMREAVNTVNFNVPARRFISSVSAQEETDPDIIRELLCKQLTSPVRWTEVMDCLGGAEAIEAGPGKVLQGIAKRMDGAPSIQLAGTLAEADALTSE